MWKETLEKLVESFACLDPVGYGHYLIAKQEELRLRPTADVEAAERQVLRLVARLEARKEASA